MIYHIRQAGGMQRPNWYVWRGESHRGAGEYLHTDGQWRWGTFNEATAKYTGFFRTRQCARDALRKTKEKVAA